MANPGATQPMGPVSFRVNQSRPGAAFQLDELSKQIIEKLQQDGRRSYAGIGKAVGLSEAAVRQRVQEAGSRIDMANSGHADCPPASLACRRALARQRWQEGQ